MKILKRIFLAVVFLSMVGVVYAVGPDWPTDRFKAFAEAKKKKKLLFLYYTSTSCKPCRGFESQTLANKEVTKFLKDNFVLLKLDAHYGEQFDFGREIGHDHNPGTLVFTPEGGLISHTKQVISAEKLLKILKDVMLAYTPLKDAKKAHKKKPEDPEANYSLGCAYYNSGKFKDAAKHLEKYLGLCEKKEEKPEKADEEKKDKQEKEKKEEDTGRFKMETRFRLGVIRLREKKKEKAKEHFKKVEELDKDGKKRMKEHIAWAKLKLLLADKKKQAQAKKAARELVDKFPKGMYLSKCLMIIADICIKERDIDSAVDAWLELQKKRFGSIEYPEMKKLLNKYWNMSSQSKKGK